MAKIAVIIGSTRDARFADTPANWIYEIARKREGWEVELVDVREFDLPFFMNSQRTPMYPAKIRMRYAGRRNWPNSTAIFS